MNINHSGQIIPTSSLFKYVNDVIIKPTQLLIKHEKQSLASENRELRRNNEDLAARIDQMFLEFDLVPASNNKDIDYFKNPKYHSGIHGATYNRIKSKNLLETTTPKSSFHTHVTTDGISVHDKYSSKKTTIENRNSKDSETQKSKKVTLNVKKNQSEEENQSIRNHSKTDETLSQRNLENKENFSSHLKSEIEKSKLSSGNGSPIYIDIFDSPEKASMFFNGHKMKIDTETDKLKPLYPNISEIPEISEQQFSLTENNMMTNRHFPVHNQNTQTKINDSRSSQTNFELLNKSTLTSDHQSPYNGIEDELILQKFNEQNLKIDNLAEKLLLIIKKSEEEKSLSNARNLKTQFKEIESKIFYEYGIPDSHSLNSVPKYSKALDFFMNDSQLNQNESIKNQSFKAPEQLYFETETYNLENISSDIQFNGKEIRNKNVSKLNSGFNNKIHPQNGKEKRSRTDFENLSFKLSETDSWQNSDKLMTINEALSDSEIYSFSQRKTSKLQKRVSSINTCNTDRSTNSEDKTISKDMESSYETLYDPVLNTKVPVNDDHMFYV